jgi:hypothetical protein
VSTVCYGLRLHAIAKHLFKNVKLLQKSKHFDADIEQENALKGNIGAGFEG